jgi:hypothetical protein
VSSFVYALLMSAHIVIYKDHGPMVLALVPCLFYALEHSDLYKRDLYMLASLVAWAVLTEILIMLFLTRLPYQGLFTVVSFMVLTQLLRVYTGYTRYSIFSVRAFPLRRAPAAGGRQHAWQRQ